VLTNITWILSSHSSYQSFGGINFLKNLCKKRFIFVFMKIWKHQRLAIMSPKILNPRDSHICACCSKNWFIVNFKVLFLTWCASKKNLSICCVFIKSIGGAGFHWCCQILKTIESTLNEFLTLPTKARILCLDSL
jgi:hypothetical protein